jgi:integrase/recombinase XerD
MPERPKAPKHTYWRAGVLWARFSVSGREYRESLRTSKIEVARSRVGPMIEKARGAASFGENRKTWAEAYLEWLGHITKHVSPKTALRYDCSINQIRQFFDHLYIDEVERKDVLDARKARMEKVSNATVRRDLQALSSLLEFAEFHGWRKGNPASLVMKKTKESRDPIMLPTEADYEFMHSRLSPPMAALMVAARATGARISELTKVDRRELNVSAGTLTIIGKRNKRRTVELGEAAVRVLSSMPASLVTKRLFHFEGRELRNASFIFSKATKASRNAAQKERRDFTGFRFHDLRHWFAVEWLRAGRSIYDLQQHLGHSTIATTEMYLEFMTVDEKENAKRPAEKALDGMRIKSA